MARSKPRGDADGETYVITCEQDFDDFIAKYKDNVLCDLKSVGDWLVVSKDDDHSDMWKEEDDDNFPCGHKLMINEYENKPNVISYLEDKIENTKPFTYHRR